MSVAALEQMTTVSDTRDGPGQRLRRIRQSKNLELSKVAAELHLRVPVLQSLEADAFDRLPEPVFVRGYLRSYARYLGVDERPILECYQERLPPDGGLPAIGMVTMRESIGSSHTAVRLITLLVVLGLITLVALWARSKSPFTLTEMASIATNNISGQGESTTTVKSSEAASPPQSPATGSNPGVAAEPVGSSMQTNAAIAPNTVPARGSTASPGGEGLTTPGVGTTTDSVATAESQTLVAAAEAAPAVWLEFIASSWLEIKDADGKKLVSGQKAKGERIQLEGKAPYWIVLGNSRAVQLTVNGKPYDLTRHGKGAVARFSFDPKTVAGG